jgi:hypothetical protein
MPRSSHASLRETASVVSLGPLTLGMDEREAARRRRVDARFRHGDAGAWVRRPELSAVVRSERLIQETEAPPFVEQQVS